MTGRSPVSRFARDVVIVGGCGHVGLPLAISLAAEGLRVAIYDIGAQAVDTVNAGRMPFAEPGAGQSLRRAVEAGHLVASTDPAMVATAEHVIVVITGRAAPTAERPPGPGGGMAAGTAGGTADLGPESIGAALADCADQLRDGQILILRSTVSPGTTASAEKLVARLGIDMDVAFCPERIAEGRAMTELRALPQIVASRSASGLERASRLFGRLTPSLVPLSVEEAELAKLFTNAWRYIRFAAANQFYMIASDLGLDYERIRQGLMQGYPRASDLAAAGFAAGPCLLKDTLGLARTSEQFPLGRAAIEVNQGLPGYLAERLATRFPLAETTVGILGMAFKGGSDDIRASLSYDLAGLLRARARAVLCTDPLVTGDPDLLPLRTVLDAADVLVIAAPHSHYRDLRTAKPVIDIWNVLGHGVLA